MIQNSSFDSLGSRGAAGGGKDRPEAWSEGTRNIRNVPEIKSCGTRFYLADLACGDVIGVEVAVHGRADSRLAVDDRADAPRDRLKRGES